MELKQFTLKNVSIVFAQIHSINHKFIQVCVFFIFK